MPYPSGLPSSGMTDVWSNTAFTPNSMVVAIQDNVTSIDNASLARSLGLQLAYVQNFVNATYLGRPSIPVANIYANQCNYTGLVSGTPRITTVSYTGVYISGAYPGAGGSWHTHLYPYQLLLERLDTSPTYNVTLDPAKLYFSVFNNNSLTLSCSSGTALLDTTNDLDIYYDTLTLSGDGSTAILASGFTATSYSNMTLRVNANNRTLQLSALSDSGQLLAYSDGYGATTSVYSAGVGSQFNAYSTGVNSHLDLYATGSGSYMTLSTNNVGSDINVLSKGDLNLWCSTGGSGLISIANKTTLGDIELTASGVIYLNSDLGRYKIYDIPTSLPPFSGYLWSSGGIVCISDAG